MLMNTVHDNLTQTKWVILLKDKTLSSKGKLVIHV